MEQLKAVKPPVLKVLDVGCGTNKFPGAVGVDSRNYEGVDVCHNLDEFPWPFADACFDRIIFKHSLSHLEDVCAVMEEVFRILKHDAVVEIVAPHFSSDNYFTDPTHRHPMGYRSMNYFCDNVPRWKYKYVDASFQLVSSYISFGEVTVDFNSLENKRIKNVCRAIGLEYLINKFPRVYEKLLAFSLPANTVYFKLQAIKMQMSS